MNKLTWITERFIQDIKKRFRQIAKYLAVLVAVVAFGQILSYYDRMEFYLPITIILVVVGSIYGWDSMEGDWEQKKIVDKLKGKR